MRGRLDPMFSCIWTQADNLSDGHFASIDRSDDKLHANPFTLYTDADCLLLKENKTNPNKNASGDGAGHRPGRSLGKMLLAEERNLSNVNKALIGQACRPWLSCCP